MALLQDYYVDAIAGSDSNNGTNMASDAKKTIGAALALITEVVTSTITIHLKPNDDEGPPTDPLYLGDRTIQGIHCIGDDTRVIIQPWDDGDQNVYWNEENYENANGDPFNSVNKEGDFDPTKDKYCVFIGSNIKLRDCKGVVFKGVSFETGENNCHAGLIAEGFGDLKVQYCRFEGKNTRVTVSLGARAHLENCVFNDNEIAVYASYGGKVRFAANNYILDPIKHGVVATGGAIIAFTQCERHPKTYYTTEIRTSTPRSDTYAAVVANQGSILTGQNETECPESTDRGHLKIYNEHTAYGSEYYGVVLESGSMLTKAGSMSFTYKSASGSGAEMSADQKVVSKTSKTTKFS